MLAAIASPRRREILRLIWDEERSAGDIRRAMPDVADLGNYVVEEHARLRGLIEALPVEGVVAPAIEVAAPTVAKKRVPAKKAATPRRRAAAAPVAVAPAAKRSRKAATNGARAG